MRAAGRRLAPTVVTVDDRWRLGWPVPQAPPEGYRLDRLPWGYLATGPDGGRLACLTGDAPGEPPRSDAVLLDPLADPYLIGALRGRGVAGEDTAVVAVGADHRWRSMREMADRLAHWAVFAPRDGEPLTLPAARLGPAAEPRRVLLIGGGRSGKSAEAELRLAGRAAVTYVAASPVPPGAAAGPGWAARVAAHRARRPAHWHTVETTDLVSPLSEGPTRGGPAAVSPSLLIDGIGGWLTATIDAAGGWDGGPAALTRVRAAMDALVAAWRDCARDVVAVSDEVGFGVVPATASGRLLRDLLGELNRRLVAESDEAALVVAGRSIELPA